MSKIDIRQREVLVIAWIIWVAKLISFASVLPKQAEPSIKVFYLELRGIESLIGLGITLATHLRNLYRRDWLRALIIFYPITALIIEATLSYPLQGSSFAWAILVVGLGCVFLFDPVRERKKSLLALSLGGFLTLGGIVLQPRLSWIPPNPITNSPGKYIPLILAGGIGSYFVILRIGKNLQQIAQMAKEQLALVAQREDLVKQLESEKEQLARTVHDLDQLRAEEQLRARREANLNQYEVLMRQGYEDQIGSFLQRLLDRFAEELPMLGGVVYMRCAEGWRVESAYALRQYLGQTYPGGTLTTAANLKSPYLISPAPAGTVKIRTSVATLTPKAILYLPFYSEATGETLAVAELLLSAPISEEREALLKIVLSRIGTYLWARQGSLSLPTGAAQ